MQKKIIALAIAGLSGAAFAQSNVTIYGVADVGFENVKADNASSTAATTANAATVSRNRVSTNSSYLGFKGSEDLGNGLKAVFQFETSINADATNGSTGTFGGSTQYGMRDTFVGLQSANLGGIKLGTLTGPARDIGTKVEMSPGYAGIAIGANLWGEMALGAQHSSIGGTVKTGIDDRFNNVVSYATPTLNGFSGSLSYVADEGKADATSATTTSVNNNGWALGLQYDNGPLYVAYAYTQLKDTSVGTSASGLTSLTTGAVVDPLTGTTSAYNDKITSQRLGAKYSFSTGTTVSGLWDQVKLELDPLGYSNTDSKRNVWDLGVKQAFGAHSVYVEFAKAEALKGDTQAANSTDAKQWILGYLYDFSKRTQLKAYYTHIDNSDQAYYGFYNNGLTGTTYGQTVQGYGVAIRHNF